MHAVGMVKDVRQRCCTASGNVYTLNGLRVPVKRAKRNEKTKRKDVAGSICVKTKNGLDVKIVFILNRSNDAQIMPILTTDLSLSDDEIVGMYARRFSIEAIFYNMKHHLLLTKETQCRCFDSAIAFNALSLLRELILEWIVRGNKDGNTIGGLFYQEREEQLLLPVKQAAALLFKFLHELPEKLAERKLIDPKHIGEVRSLIIHGVLCLFGSACDFIRNFMYRCGKNSLLTANKLASEITLSR